MSRRPAPLPPLDLFDLAHFWSRVDIGPGCWLHRGRTNGFGYVQVRLGGRKGRLFPAHRVAYALAVDDPGESLVLHRCDVRHCVRPDHLFLGTQSDNMADMVAKGRGRSWMVAGHTGYPSVRDALGRFTTSSRPGLRCG